MRQRCLTGCLLLLTAVMLLGCQPELPQPTPTSIPTLTPTPSLDGAESVAQEFLRAWQNGAYERMYSMLSSAAQDSYSQSKFISRYQAIADEATITSLTTSIGGVQRVLTANAQVTFTLTVDTQLVGQFQLETTLDLSHQGQHWAVDWEPKAIFPLLIYDNLVHMFIDVPSRGSIYDRKGLPLATDGAVIEVGVVPGRIEDEAYLLQVLSALFGQPQDEIQAQYAYAARPDWFMPISEITQDAFQANEAMLSSLPGITWRKKAVRIYPQGNLAGQLIGYIAEIDPDTLARLEGEGYRAGDMVGAAGLEGWGEAHLAGTRGATLAIISPDGRIVWTLGERASRLSHDIHTTLDVELQREVQRILGTRVGSIVVLDARNGQILSMVSQPGYDPNVLVTGESEKRQALLNDPQRPFLNRAVAGLYPPGSTFKIVTMVAGMEELGLTEHHTYFCAGRWDGLADGATRYCWVRSGHGTLDYLNGLVQSCDTVFWEVGKALNEWDAYALPRYARAFGLGSTSGLNALGEAAGLVPDPDWKALHYDGAEQEWLPRDAVNMAIGQGDVLATPLQMANLVAAVANGGTLYRPYIVERIHSTMEGDIQATQPVAIGQLPASPANLEVVRRAMAGVVSYGTASRAFYGATIPMAGKSGTAEAPPNEPHAWFVGYAPAYDPQIAVAVILEHGGEGGANAAPLFRQAVEAYMALPRG